MSESEPLLLDDELNPIEYIEPPPTPLPMLKMLMICIVTFVEPVQFGIIFPFVYFMVRDFHVSDNEKEIGFYVGLLTSSFCLAQCFSSLPWGRISDRVGRKPVLLIGLVGNAITCTLFGMSKSLWFAIAMRATCGFLNGSFDIYSGNVGVVKSMLGEISNSSNRGRAFSYWQAAFGTGTIVGPMLGGLLSDPIKQFPWLFKDAILFKEYPYLFPCLASSFISFGGAILGYCYLEESLKRPQIQNRDSAETMDEEDALLIIAQSNEQTPTQPIKPARILTKAVCKSILCYATWCLITIIYEETYALFVAEPLRAGGLQFTSFEIGLALSFTGFAQLFGQLLLYPYLEPKMSKEAMFRLASVLICFFAAALPFCSNFARYIITGEYYTDDQKIKVYILLQILLCGKTIASVLGYIPVMIMVNDSAPNDRSLGTVHGIGQIAAAVARSIGPATGGALWSWTVSNGLSFPFDYHFTFICVGVLALGAYMETFI
ncbi:hypothetical protein HDV06_004351 [Boothiomyces sp. JEL0866]|nr:hypothetical protein HDV06_004351 [Boothiomyces sp. JEL0866]